jgi:formylglycine-generating enzyme required for sulfatase activity
MIRLSMCILLLGGCASHSGSTPTAALPPQPYVETVPGSTVTFTMRPVTTWIDQACTRTIWYAETETTWNAYDVFYLRLDEHRTATDLANAGRDGPDAITRPTLPYEPPDRGWGHSDFPAIGITLHAAMKYCEWLSERTGKPYRLPTAQEWRDATWETCGESQPIPPAQLAWLADNSGKSTHPVASLKPNHLGLHDLIGNVAEWCVGDEGTPVVLGASFATDIATMNDDAIDRELLRGVAQTREWNANDPAFPKSRWWLRDAPFVGFRVVCDEGPP